MTSGLSTVMYLYGFCVSIVCEELTTIERSWFRLVRSVEPPTDGALGIALSEASWATAGSAAMVQRYERDSNNCCKIRRGCLDSIRSHPCEAVWSCLQLGSPKAIAPNLVKVLPCTLLIFDSTQTRNGLFANLSFFSQSSVTTNLAGTIRLSPTIGHSCSISVV